MEACAWVVVRAISPLVLSGNNNLGMR